MTLIAHNHAAAVVHSAETTFDSPSLAIIGARANRATPLRSFRCTPLKGWDGRFDTTLAQFSTKISAVKSFVRHQFLRTSLGTSVPLGLTNGLQRRLGQGALARLSTVQMQTNRQAMTIDDPPHLAALANLGLAYSITPFLVGIKLSSRNTWAHASFSWESNSVSEACQRRLQVHPVTIHLGAASTSYLTHNLAANLPTHNVS